ncbi:unnamed protein product [Gadus morhua 'NCC']
MFSPETPKSDSEVYELRTPAADSSPYDAVTHSRGSSCVRAMMSRRPPHQVVCSSPHGALCLRHARGRLCGGQGAPTSAPNATEL